MNKLTAGIAGLVAGVVVPIVVASPAAADDVTYELAFTAGMGAYPRSTPAYEARTGTAAPEGSMIAGSCWGPGEDITTYYGYTSSVWVRDTSGYYWPEAWLDTGSDGVPVGLPSCDAAEETSSNTGWQPNCAPGGDYIAGTISVTDNGEGPRISLTPTQTAREAWGKGDGWNSTVSMWHAIQDCVPNLYHETADSVWQQLECHQRFGTLIRPDTGYYATGDTYDLETYTDPLTAPNDLSYMLTQCLSSEYLTAPLYIFAMND